MSSKGRQEEKQTLSVILPVFSACRGLTYVLTTCGFTKYSNPPLAESTVWSMKRPIPTLTSTSTYSCIRGTLYNRNKRSTSLCTPLSFVHLRRKTYYTPAFCRLHASNCLQRMHRRQTASKDKPMCSYRRKTSTKTQKKAVQHDRGNRDGRANAGHPRVINLAPKSPVVEPLWTSSSPASPDGRRAMSAL